MTNDTERWSLPTYVEAAIDPSLIGPDFENTSNAALRNWGTYSRVNRVFRTLGVGDSPNLRTRIYLSVKNGKPLDEKAIIIHDLIQDILNATIINGRKYEFDSYIAGTLRIVHTGSVSIPGNVSLTDSSTSRQPSIPKFTTVIEQAVNKKLLDRDVANIALKIFINDPQRQTLKGDRYAVVISRDPVDILSMSTGREWMSCKHMDIGCTAHLLKHEIIYGSLIAYLIRIEDVSLERKLRLKSSRPRLTDDQVKKMSRYEYTTLDPSRLTLRDRQLKYVSKVDMQKPDKTDFSSISEYTTPIDYIDPSIYKKGTIRLSGLSNPLDRPLARIHIQPYGHLDLQSTERFNHSKGPWFYAAGLPYGWKNPLFEKTVARFLKYLNRGVPAGIYHLPNEFYIDTGVTKDGVPQHKTLYHAGDTRLSSWKEQTLSLIIKTIADPTSFEKSFIKRAGDNDTHYEHSDYLPLIPFRGLNQSEIADLWAYVNTVDFGSLGYDKDLKEEIQAYLVQSPEIGTYEIEQALRLKNLKVYVNLLQNKSIINAGLQFRIFKLCLDQGVDFADLFYKTDTCLLDVMEPLFSKIALAYFDQLPNAFERIRLQHYDKPPVAEDSNQAKRIHWFWTTLLRQHRDTLKTSYKQVSITYLTHSVNAINEQRWPSTKTLLDLIAKGPVDWTKDDYQAAAHIVLAEDPFFDLSAYTFTEQGEENVSQFIDLLIQTILDEYSNTLSVIENILQFILAKGTLEQAERIIPLFKKVENQYVFSDASTIVYDLLNVKGFCFDILPSIAMENALKTSNSKMLNAHNKRLMAQSQVNVIEKWVSGESRNHSNLVIPYRTPVEVDGYFKALTYAIVCTNYANGLYSTMKTVLAEMIHLNILDANMFTLPETYQIRSLTTNPFIEQYLYQIYCHDSQIFRHVIIQIAKLYDYLPRHVNSIANFKLEHMAAYKSNIDVSSIALSPNIDLVTLLTLEIAGFLVPELSPQKLDSLMLNHVDAVSSLEPFEYFFLSLLDDVNWFIPYQSTRLPICVLLLGPESKLPTSSFTPKVHQARTRMFANRLLDRQLITDMSNGGTMILQLFHNATPEARQQLIESPIVRKAIEWVPDDIPVNLGSATVKEICIGMRVNRSSSLWKLLTLSDQVKVRQSPEYNDASYYDDRVSDEFDRLKFNLKVENLASITDFLAEYTENGIRALTTTLSIYQVLSIFFNNDRYDDQQIARCLRSTTQEDESHNSVSINLQYQIVTDILAKRPMSSLLVSQILNETGTITAAWISIAKIFQSSSAEEAARFPLNQQLFDPNICPVVRQLLEAIGDPTAYREREYAIRAHKDRFHNNETTDLLAPLSNSTADDSDVDVQKVILALPPQLRCHYIADYPRLASHIERHMPTLITSSNFIEVIQLCKNPTTQLKLIVRALNTFTSLYHANSTPYTEVMTRYLNKNIQSETIKQIYELYHIAVRYMHRQLLNGSKDDFLEELNRAAFHVFVAYINQQTWHQMVKLEAFDYAWLCEDTFKYLALPPYYFDLVEPKQAATFFTHGIKAVKLVGEELSLEQSQEIFYSSTFSIFDQAAFRALSFDAQAAFVIELRNVFAINHYKKFVEAMPLYLKSETSIEYFNRPAL